MRTAPVASAVAAAAPEPAASSAQPTAPTATKPAVVQAEEGRAVVVDVRKMAPADTAQEVSPQLPARNNAAGGTEEQRLTRFMSKSIGLSAYQDVDNKVAAAAAAQQPQAESKRSPAVSKTASAEVAPAAVPAEPSVSEEEQRAQYNARLAEADVARHEQMIRERKNEWQKFEEQQQQRDAVARDALTGLDFFSPSNSHTHTHTYIQSIHARAHSHTHAHKYVHANASYTCTFLHSHALIDSLSIGLRRVADQAAAHGDAPEKVEASKQKLEERIRSDPEPEVRAPLRVSVTFLCLCMWCGITLCMYVNAYACEGDVKCELFNTSLCICIV